MDELDGKWGQNAVDAVETGVARERRKRVGDDVIMSKYVWHGAFIDNLCEMVQEDHNCMGLREQSFYLEFSPGEGKGCQWWGSCEF